jgi:hypothetical protein
MTNTQDLMKKHKVCIKLLAMINLYHTKIEIKEESIENFPDLERKIKHDIEIYKMCIQRLTERYNLIFKLLKND